MKTQYKVLIFVFSILFLIILVGLAMFLLKRANSFTLSTSNPIKTEKIETNSFDGFFIPNFDSIQGIAQRNSEKWIATKSVAVRIKDYKVTFFSQKDGLVADNTTGVINRSNQIWFASQGGASRYIDTENKFKNYLVGESNVNLFEDPYDKKFYASTFDNFFVYNEKNDQWDKIDDVNSPINFYQMEFNKDFIITTNYQVSKPAVVYSRQTGSWTKSLIPEYGNQQAFKLFKAGERIFIYGRSKDYNSCEDQGKKPNSLFFEFTNGQWVSADVLNKTFFNHEPFILKSESSANLVSFYDKETPCSHGQLDDVYTKIVVDFSDNGIKIESQSKTSTDAVNQARNAEYNNAVQEISKITGLAPYHKVLSFENNILLTEAHQSNGAFYFTQITVNGNKYDEKELISSKELGEVNTLNLSSCGQNGTKYLTAASVNQMGSDLAGNFQLYEVTNSGVKKMNFDLTGFPYDSYGEMVCFSNSFYWVEGANIKKATIQDNQLNIEVIKDLKDLGNNAKSELSKNGKLWFSFYGEKGKIYSFDLTSSNIGEYNISLPTENLVLRDASSDYLWFSYHSNSDTKSNLVKVNLKGETVKNYFIYGSMREYLNVSKDKYLISSTKELLILNDNSPIMTIPIDDKLLPFYSRETDFMSQKPIFAFFQDKNNILFTNETGSFIIPLASLLKTK